MQNRKVEDSDSTDITVEEFLKSKEPYDQHFKINIDNDSIMEVVIVNKSNEKSDCLSMFDTACNFMELEIYRKSNDHWELIKGYKIADFKNTVVGIDSLSSLIVQQNFNPSGLSQQKNTETFKYIEDDFYLQQIHIFINTKLNSNFGRNADKWNYQIDFDSQQLKINHTKVRILEDQKGEKYLSENDTIYQELISRDFAISLGEMYKLDTIIGEENLIHSF
ncbi:hypothetical protein QYS49_38600 [Marivirga salinae]|uniref:Uncharacterized protein n=1 Tax=Marivirga salinarum TaxID=3059078 RepID=A0AA51RE10_9BACT|nr:hypothetical protein [Marivirga sp. BDSF4-3]WMN11504.1 hypothetical protein QYS49_38600 [Marivirga sp. BDSF4-3]